MEQYTAIDVINSGSRKNKSHRGKSHSQSSTISRLEEDDEKQDQLSTPETLSKALERMDYIVSLYCEKGLSDSVEKLISAQASALLL